MEGTGRCQGTPLGIELILPDWFYAGVLDAALVLTIDPAYFRLTGGIERWLYRLVRKHGGGSRRLAVRLPHLHRKSGSTAKPYDFACDLRALVARQSLPGYVLGIERMDGAELLTFRPVPCRHGTGITVRACGRARAIRRAVSCYQAWDYRAIRRAIGRKANAGAGFGLLNFPNLNL
jgi:plasmid replication initiation protein